MGRFLLVCRSIAAILSVQRCPQLRGRLRKEAVTTARSL
jgi:hypothetical protein